MQNCCILSLGMSTNPLQEHKQRVTEELLKNSGTIRFIKYQANRNTQISKSQSDLLSTTCWAIINHGIEFEALETEIVMMAVMTINHVAKYDKVNKLVLDRKNELQGVLIRRDDVSRSEGKGDYSGTIQLRHRNWNTHIPYSVIQKVLS